jgi:hypothetical protein
MSKFFGWGVGFGAGPATLTRTRRGGDGRAGAAVVPVRDATHGAPTGTATAGFLASGYIDVQAVRRHFAFPKADRIVTNNAASTQPPLELLELYRSLGPWYETCIGANPAPRSR